MTDLRERFEAKDLLPVDDVWADVLDRVAEPDAPRARLRAVGSSDGGRFHRDGMRKVLTIAAVFALTAASVAIAVRAFQRAESNRPASGDTFAKVKGWIACGGDQLRAIDPNSSAGSVNQIRLTSYQDAESPVAWSQDGSRLLVDRDSRGGHYLFVLDGDGTEVRLEPVSGVSDVSSFSPSGRDVVYEMNGAIYSVGVDTHTVHLIARGGDLLPNYFLHPSLSLDGTRIAYMRLVDGQGPSLWVMNADGSGRRLVSSSERLGDFGPLVWSPDGTRLAIESYTTNHHFVIDMIGLDGTGLTRVAAHATSPAWSPDGSRIAFTSMTDGHLNTMQADGSDVRDLGTSCSGIAWNPILVTEGGT